MGGDTSKSVMLADREAGDAVKGIDAGEAPGTPVSGWESEGGVWVAGWRHCGERVKMLSVDG
jgi:hypothetical protein